MQLTGLAAIAIVVAAGTRVARVRRPGARFPRRRVSAGIAAFYRALAIGTMSVISPISASGAAAIPVVGVATGERPGVLVVIGMVAALIGADTATRAPDSGQDGGSSRDAPAAALAALGFGGFYVGMNDAVSDVEPFWALLAARTSAGIVLIAVLLARPRLGVASRPPPRSPSSACSTSARTRASRSAPRPGC